jgi:hypothetical protein
MGHRSNNGKEDKVGGYYAPRLPAEHSLNRLGMVFVRVRENGLFSQHPSYPIIGQIDSDKCHKIAVSATISASFRLFLATRGREDAVILTMLG